jgi:hypothetical protein
MISTTECLYEHRESAEFIVFADMDDLIIPKEYQNLYEEVFALSQQFPQASSFGFLWARFNVNPGL